MTPKERAAMQQALEALELYGTDDMAYIKSEKAITALREALANTRSSIRSTFEYSEQAELEPVGVVEGSGEWGIAGVLVAGVPIGTKLYAAPVSTKAAVLAEREACAKVCEEFYTIEGIAQKCAAAIRASGELRGEENV